jgi:shikimate kinase
MLGNKSNIVLIGMPGVGKSTVGVLLAKVLGFQFVDSDLLIQRHTGKLLREIIAECGTEGFLKIEEDVNRGIFEHRSVIATGGSVVYGEAAMKHLAEDGVMVYLKLPYEELEKRLGDVKGRGVVLRDGQTLRDLYDERVPLYEKYADVVADETGCSVEQTIDRIIAKL